MEVPCFDGHLQIEDFLNWIYAVENFFECMEIDKYRQVKIVAYKLIGEAYAWWEQLQNQRRRERKHPIRTWSKIKKLLEAKFFPRDYEHMLY